MKFLGTIIHTTFMIALIAIGLLLTLPFLPFEHGLEMRIVESGSMEPAIPTGSLVALWPTGEYQVGDIVTFRSSMSEVPTTHRITDSYTENGQTWFITKGDANEEVDSAAVPLGTILGEVRASVPKVGFVLDFARQPLGFLLLIVLPALAIILGEIEKIWKELRRRRTGATTGTVSTSEQAQFTPDLADVPDYNPETPAAEASPSRAMIDIGTPVRYRLLPTLDLRDINERPVAAMGHPSGSRRRGWLGIIGVLAAVAVFAGAGMIGSTVSYITDVETAVENLLRASEISVEVVPTESTYAFVDGDLPDDTLSLAITTVAGSGAVSYSVAAEAVSGDTVFCENINSEFSEPFLYNDPLVDLSADEVVFVSPWEIEFSLQDETDLSGGMTCELALRLTAWQNDAPEGEGFFDEELVTLSFTYSETEIVPLQLETAESLSAEVTTVPETDITPESSPKEGPAETDQEGEEALTSEGAPKEQQQSETESTPEQSPKDIEETQSEPEAGKAQQQGTQAVETDTRPEEEAAPEETPEKETVEAEEEVVANEEG